MIVPEYWAEERIQKRFTDRQVTVRRFGWSNESEAAAREHARERAQSAFDRIVAGEDLLRREPKVAYNGAEGVPIREEVVERRGDNVLSRNGYGALCLNTPDVLFADIDFETEAPLGLKIRMWLAMTIAGAIVAVFSGSWLVLLIGAFFALMICDPVAALVHKRAVKAAGGHDAMAMARVKAFLAVNPDWRLRVYRTPAGLRLLAMHDTFEPRSEEVSAFFAAIGADEIYARMCRVQNCFRARVSPKPWRAGVGEHLKPRPGVWPVKDEYLPARRRWIERYERAAGDFASCRFVETLGEGSSITQAETLRDWHDQLCRADSDLPLA